MWFSFKNEKATCSRIDANLSLAENKLNDVIDSLGHKLTSIKKEVSSIKEEILNIQLEIYQFPQANKLNSGI
jgi:hypothetical protein